MYYIGTYNQVKYYIDKVDGGEKYNGITSTWAKPLQSFKDLEKYAVIKHDKYNYSTMLLVETLPSEFVNTEL